MEGGGVGEDDGDVVALAGKRCDVGVEVVEALAQQPASDGTRAPAVVLGVQQPVDVGQGEPEMLGVFDERQPV